MMKQEVKLLLVAGVGYLGFKAYQIYTAIKKLSYAPTGIDRRDNKKGYTYNNSQPCCYTCNHMKWGMTEYNFLEHIKIILRNFYKE